MCLREHGPAQSCQRAAWNLRQCNFLSKTNIAPSDGNAARFIAVDKPAHNRRRTFTPSFFNAWFSVHKQWFHNSVPYSLLRHFLFAVNPPGSLKYNASSIRITQHYPALSRNTQKQKCSQLSIMGKHLVSVHWLLSKGVSLPIHEMIMRGSDRIKRGGMSTWKPHSEHQCHGTGILQGEERLFL